jgi:YaiO family outer membrane protein
MIFFVRWHHFTDCLYIVSKNGELTVPIRTCLFSLLLLLIPATTAFGQTADPDQLFSQARTAAFEQNDFPKAIRLAKEALNLAPDYLDVKEFLGRVYIFNNEHELGRPILIEVLKEDQKRKFARLTLVDSYLNTGNYVKADEYAYQGLRLSPSDADFMFKRGLAQEQQGRSRLASIYYENILELDPTYPFVQQKLKDLRGYRLDWGVYTQFTNSQLNNNFDPWNIGTVGLIRRTPIGSFNAEVNYGSRFGINDTEFQVIGYPVLNDRTYAFVNAAFSNNNFFPAYRLGGAVYRVLPKRVEAEAGFRLLSFDANNVYQYTGSISKIFSRYRVSARGFLTSVNNSNALNGLILFRSYFKKITNYVEVRGGYGQTNNLFNSQQDLNRNESFEAGLNAQYEVNPQFFIYTDISYFSEEFEALPVRRRIDSLFGIRYLFR